MPRPPSYQRSDVLQKATDVFWERGYGATSVADLVAATGLRPGSLYAAFGSKKGLFLEVLDQYHDAFTTRLAASTATAGTPLGKLRALLEATARDSAEDRRQRGCLAVNALLEVAGHDADIAARLREHNERLRRRLEHLLADAAAAGEIDGAPSARDLSLFVLNNLWGMRVMCKSAPAPAALDAIVDGVMTALRRGGAGAGGRR